jgi:SAM-dependent methyltransferase
MMSTYNLISLFLKKEGKMKFISKRKFFKKSLQYKYWFNTHERRWEYIKHVIKELKKHNPENLLEIGSMYIPLSNKSFILSLNREELVNDKGILYNLNHTPYPFKDNYFDFSIGLQVWEHLENQQEAFKELYRISKNIILSFPYKWQKNDPSNIHHNITDEIICDWTCGIKPSKTKLLTPDDTKLKNQIKIYYWFKT